MRLRVKISLAVIALLATHYLAALLGARGATARAAFVQSVSIQQEEKCWSSKDVECYRVNWQLRAAAAAAGAELGLLSPIPSGVDRELEEYLRWYETIAPYQPPAK